MFLTRDFAYKLKKPVRYDFLDFSSRERRHRDCLREVRLNWRLSKHVYHRIVPLSGTDRGQLGISEHGTPVDWLVKMERLSQKHMLDSAIENLAVSKEDVRRFSKVLTKFYNSSQPIDISPHYYMQHQGKHKRSRKLLSRLGNENTSQPA